MISSNFYIFFRLPNKNEDMIYSNLFSNCLTNIIYKDKDMIYRDLFSNCMTKELFNEEVRECGKNKYNYIGLNKDDELVFNKPIEYE